MNRACYPKEKHQNSRKWVKFMNFSFWPFLWFDLPGRLLKGSSAVLGRGALLPRSSQVSENFVGLDYNGLRDVALWLGAFWGENYSFSQCCHFWGSLGDDVKDQPGQVIFAVLPCPLGPLNISDCCEIGIFNVGTPSEAIVEILFRQV